jgi:hypothetical protein
MTSRGTKMKFTRVSHGVSKETMSLCDQIPIYAKETVLYHRVF